MKRITPVILTALSVLALSFSVSTYADNTDSDGFVIFEAQTTDASQTASSETTVEVENTESAAQAPAIVKAKKPKAKKKVAKNKARKRAKRSKRVVRKKRSTRTTRRATRSSNLRKASSYRVRKGDTLYRISVNSGVKLSRLIRMNKLHGSKKHSIKTGQRIRLR